MIVSSTTPLGAAREQQRGQILVLFAFVLIALLLISALAVDYGGWLLSRRSYQNAADQAAIAGAYLLTSPIANACSGSVSSKNECAREAAWTSLKTQLGLSSLIPSTQRVTSTAANSPYIESGYRIWVDSPPSDAGSAYPGFASSSKTIFVRVERDISANLSRIITTTTRVGAWATAGRIPKSFAIIVLCQTSCHGSADDLKVNGGSTLILATGDIGSNSYVTTNGSGSYVALGSDSSAFMNQPSQCTTTSVSCRLIGYDGTNPVPSTRYSGQALPQVADPQYAEPTISSSAVPWQCNGTGAIAAITEPVAEAPSDLPVLLAGAVAPPTTPPVTLGATATVSGQVTAAVGGAKINGILVTLTPGGLNNTTSGSGANAGKYSIAGVTTGATYTLTATDATGTYHTYTQSTGNIAGNTTINFTMNKNPIISGTVRDSSFVGIVGATVYVTLGATTWTTVSGAAGAYSIVAQPPAGAGPWTFSTYASATGYASDSPYTVSANVDTTTASQNHTLTANPGTINGFVTSGGSPVSGATVTASTGGVPGTTIANGSYTITGVPAGAAVVTASKVGYSNGTASTVVPPGGTVNNVNITINQAGAISGTVTDSSTGLAIPNLPPYDSVSVTATNGVSTGTATTNSAGFYMISGLSPSNPKYTVTVTATGYPTTSLNNVTVNSGATTSGQNFALYPSNCGTGGQKGSWTCSATCGSLSSSGATETCSKFDASNAIRPGTYDNITISSGCAWIDPLGAPTGMATSQTAGVVHVKGTFQLQQGAFLFGDGVTIVLDSGANMDFKKDSGFVVNYEDDSNTFNGSKFRTGGYLGGGGVSYCSGDSNSFANYQRGGWTTKTRATWTGSGTSWCYTDTGSNPAELGMTWYLRGADTSNGGGRFNSSSSFSFLFNGVLYGPQDDIGLNGSPAQAAAGQIVAWTLTYGGGTNIYQSYNGIEVDGPPYLIEPYIGE